MRSFKAVKLVIPLKGSEEEIVRKIHDEFGEELIVTVDSEKISIEGDVMSDYKVRNRILVVAGV